MPTLVDGVLQPRRVDLRVFSVAGRGGTAQALRAPLTRVALGSGAGRGSKDTWLRRLIRQPVPDRRPAGRLVITTVVPSGLGVAVMSPTALISVPPRPRSIDGTPLPPLAVVAHRDPDRAVDHGRA